PCRSIVGWLVYGSSGAFRGGASAKSIGGGVGTGGPRMVGRKALKHGPAARRRRPPPAPMSTPTPRAATAATRSKRKGSAIPGPRSTRRWLATRVEGEGRDFGAAGAGRPVDGGRGLTWGGRGAGRGGDRRVAAWRAR